MRLIKTKAAVAAVGLALSLAACGEAGSGEGSDVEAEEVESGKFEEGSKMAELAEAGEVTVGVKFDQPGLGFKDAASDIPTGFDVEPVAEQTSSPCRSSLPWTSLSSLTRICWPVTR